MDTLPSRLYSAAQVRELDRTAIEELGIPGTSLMERAGQAAFRALRSRWPQAKRLAVVCGSGNNGGDGYVLARLARHTGLDVTVHRVGDPSVLKPDAMRAYQAARSNGVPIGEFKGCLLKAADVVVDALFGTGLSGPLEGQALAAVEAINHSGRPVLSLDIPSGLDADSGEALGSAVYADMTVTFLGFKQGMYVADGPDHCGAILVDTLDVPAEVFARFEPAVQRLNGDKLSRLLEPRAKDAHKGDFGHVLIVGGDHGMWGAVRLAAEAAARVGAGLVSVATRAAHAPLVSIGCPEIMSHGIEKPYDMEPLLERASVIVVGPGLGRGAWGRGLLGRILDSERPLVVDADALNLLTLEPTRRIDWVITPHPGEAGRLLGCSAAEIQRNRFAAALRIQHEYGGVCILKGAGTLVVGHEGMIGVCPGGNPGMASGGMGDLLTGAVAGLIAQGIGNADAARLGVCLHAAAGDTAAKSGQRGMLASDLLPELRRLVNP